MPTTVDQAVEAAMADSPTLNIRKSDIDVAKAETVQSKEGFYPHVTLEGQALRSEDQIGVESSREEVYGGLVMRWNLYRGGADEAKEREYIARQAQSEYDLADSKREVEQRVRQSWAAREAARARAERYAQQVSANREVLEAYKKQFQAGDRTLLDVLDAQNELFLSTSNMLTAYYTALYGDYQVLAERGALLSSLGVQKVAEASVNQ